MKSHFCIFIGLLLMAPSFFAQGQNIPIEIQLPPEKEIVKAPPSFARWSIKLEYRQANRRESNSVISKPSFPGNARDSNVALVEYTKTCDIARVLTTYQDGSQKIAYLVGELELMTNPEQKSLIHVKTLDLKEESALETYPCFGWIDRTSYSGMENMAGAKCYAFQRYRNSKNKGFVMKSYVSVDGLWPIAFQEGDVVGRYIHYDPPSEKITLPANFQKALDEYKKPSF